MQVTTYGKTSSPVEVIKPVNGTSPSDPTNPSNPSNPNGPTTTTLPSALTGMPVFMDLLKLSTVSVFQSVSYNRIRKEYYSAQAETGSNGSHDPYDSTVVARCDDGGKLIDQMKILDAGHGTGLVVENYGTKNTVYIWLPIQSQSNAYYRFLYKKGTYKFSQLVSKTKILVTTGLYHTFHTDWEADAVMERIPNQDKTMTLNKRKISDLVKGTNKVYATIRTEVVPIQQGWAMCNDSAYILQGGLNGETMIPASPTLLDTYNWSSGTRVDRLNLQSLGTEGDGHWLKDTHEPEGLSVYRDPTTKKASLIVGIATGIYVKGTSGHKWWVYRFSNIGLAP